MWGEQVQTAHKEEVKTNVDVHQTNRCRCQRNKSFDGRGLIFAIDGHRTGPLDAEAIRQRMVDAVITADTLAWCQGMEEWKSAQEIPELRERLAELLIAHVVPPPLEQNVADVTPLTPPPLPPESKGSGAVKQDDSASQTAGVPEGLSDLEANAYRFTMWFTRSKMLREYIHKNPSKALPIAAATVLSIAILFVAVMFSISDSINEAENYAPQQPGGMQQPAWVDQHQAWREGYRDRQAILDDAYRQKRKSDDTMSETYRRGNYDWYTDDKD
ncbi:hypothetical protein CA13_10070 [Planctomycetes bacterium CA13]|uniref:GYF domain-containing protein n=1 Tax=Novipirellula herctigrandis TaxID=2527986 RepID=A0A5C5YYP3_9BACT|nr:hypothetical protein CA13_10070 [Planctomycetes bacterium CA13]